MGIIDKESAMNLAMGVSTTNSSDEESVSLMPLGDIDDSKKELERLRVIYQKFADDLKAIHDKANREIMELQAAQLRASAEGEITSIREAMTVVRNEEMASIEALRDKMLKLPQEWEFIWLFLGRLTVDSTNDLMAAVTNEVEKLVLEGKLTAKAKKDLLKLLDVNKDTDKGPFEKLNDSMSFLFKSMGSGVEMTKGKWKDLGTALGECSAIATQALSGISQIGGAFGMSKEAQATFDQVSGMVSGMGNMAKGLASGDISSVISGGVGMITSATKLFDFKTKKADKEIKKHAENLKKLKTEYDGLARAASQALGTEEYETKVDQIANLEKQKIEVEGQLRAEDSKKRKKKDKGKIEEYKKAITSLENQIADSKQNIIDELMTTDLKSFASQLGSTLVDAFSQGTEGIDAIMQGKVDTLIKNMLAKQLSMKLIQKSLQPVFDAAERFTAEESEEGVNFSTGEIRQIKGLLESSMSSISAQSKEWVQMMTDMGLVVNKDMSSRVQEVTGQLQAAMTEGTASQLVGLWNMTASDVRAIRDWLLTGTVTVPESPFNMTQMIELQNEIAVNTRVTAQSTTATMHELGRVNQHLESIDRNTRGYVGRGR
ncbi:MULTISPECIES: hypothetical protein [Butyricimonas]|uniref:hypothetical protein n=1 Tax=Butyricimonas TaxID=574697 RepID=UPI0020801D10|nr:hypothetical protein [Butyricimonas paravirosa]BDF52675.1 hypothetical protein CE91St21_01100 [Odoribacteraceae bacterium]GKH91614.1 hypothetical protein CE91St23_01100 [Odoribacteraceae bacterium]GKH96232.1 hypothetical protein CE91St22_01100 [Odoribacteraceae bacterium]GKI03111.1 hypothetical protein CE91St24_23860 [Odoribacteraceae bacterium]